MDQLILARRPDLALINKKKKRRELVIYTRNWLGYAYREGVG